MRIPAGDNSTVLHALFPTLVYQTSLAEHAVFRRAFEENAREFGFRSEGGTSGRHFAGEYHGKILLHQEETLRPFFTTLAEQVGRYLNVLGMKPGMFEMQCLKSWFVVCESADDEDDAIMSHRHSCSDISWVYYVDVPEDCSAIQFHAGRPLNTAPFDSAFHYDWHNQEKSAVDKPNWWNRDSWSIQPKAGDLLIFPGHQLHSVDAHSGAGKRISVAGDLALTLREEYQDLEFGRTARKHWLTLPLSDD